VRKSLVRMTMGTTEVGGRNSKKKGGRIPRVMQLQFGSGHGEWPTIANLNPYRANMKIVNRFVLVVFLTVGALLIAGTNQASAAEKKSSSNQPKAVFASGLSDGGRFTVKRSPILGDNVSFVIKVDGQIAGTSVRYRDVEFYLAPGQHVIEATPNRLGGAWRGTVDVQLGKAYAYVASYNSSQLVLGRLMP
jgi:hypothetical protein